MATDLPSLLVDIKPGIIDLGWGHPSPRLHPFDEVKEASLKMFQKGDNSPLQYGATQGFGPFLESLATFLQSHLLPALFSMLLTLNSPY